MATSTPASELVYQDILELVLLMKREILVLYQLQQSKECHDDSGALQVAEQLEESDLRAVGKDRQDIISLFLDGIVDLLDDMDALFRRLVDRPLEGGQQ